MYLNPNKINLFIKRKYEVSSTHVELGYARVRDANRTNRIESKTTTTTMLRAIARREVRDDDDDTHAYVTPDDGVGVVDTDDGRRRMDGSHALRVPCANDRSDGSKPNEYGWSSRVMTGG